MNAKQFVNSVLSAAIENSPRSRGFLYFFPKFFFPSFLKSIDTKAIKHSYHLAFILYLITFFLIFIVQAALAHSNNLLFIPDSISGGCLSRNEECLKYFFGDLANLLNYSVFVEAYCISGCYFLIYSANMDTLLSESKLMDPPGYINRPIKNSTTKGSLSVLFTLFFVLLGSAGYAVEIQNYPPHWYMNKSENGIISYSLYYYLFINYSLLLLVAFVGVAHFGLFKTAGEIVNKLRYVYFSEDKSLVSLYLDENEIKKWLSPFSTQILVSKVFVLSIILNMTSWKLWEPNVGIMNDLSIIIMIVIGMWVVTMPRYYVQYHLFKIKIKFEKDEYKDIRMSWILGGSAAVDILLIAIAGKALLDMDTILALLS